MKDNSSRRVLRGGAWLFYYINARATCRNHLDPHGRVYGLGLRVVRSTTSEKKENEGKDDER